MKMNKKRFFCVAIMVVMLFSTMGVGAFAAVDQGIDVQGNTQSEEVQGDAVVTEAPAGEVEGIDAKVVKNEAKNDFHAVSGTNTLQGHQRILVRWPAYEVSSEQYEKVLKGDPEGEYAYYKVTEERVGYVIVRNGGVYDEAGKDATYYEDRAVGDGLTTFDGGIHNGGVFSYKVVAKTALYAETVNAEDIPEGATVTEVTDPGQPKLTQEQAIVQAPATAGTTCVRTSAVKLKLKTKKKLTSHDYQRVTRTFAKGTTLYTCGFGVGKHMFIYGDNMFYLNRISTKSASSVCTSVPYNQETAEYFINGRGNGSASGRLIWVSVFTQHMYIFNGSAGNWHLEYCWPISTGKASTPTIRTIDPQGVAASGKMIGTAKTICKKLKKRHGIPYWNCFSSYNAIHGKKAKWSIKATPKSGGCVRNTNDHALFVYNNCPKGTTVVLF